MGDGGTVEQLRSAHCAGIRESAAFCAMRQDYGLARLRRLHMRVDAPSATGHDKDDGGGSGGAHPFGGGLVRRGKLKDAGRAGLGFKRGIDAVFKSRGSGKLGDQAQRCLGGALRHGNAFWARGASWRVGTKGAVRVRVHLGLLE